MISSPPASTRHRRRAGRRADGTVEPHAVAQGDAVDLEPGRVARRRAEGVALDRAEPEALTLVEAQVADVRRGGGHDHLDGRFDCREIDGGPHELSTDAAA